MQRLFRDLSRKTGEANRVILIGHWRRPIRVSTIQRHALTFRQVIFSDGKSRNIKVGVASENCA
jgi:hypothetical protein